MPVGETYTATFPNEVFLLVLADDSGESGDFTISYQFIDLDPEEVLIQMSQAERDAYYAENPKYATKDVADTNTFWFFIAGGVVGAILIGILIFCLVRMKKKNDTIVAKVEKLSARGRPSEGNKPDINSKDDFYNP